MKSVFTQSITNDVNLLYCNCQVVAFFNSNKDHPLSPQPSPPPENRKNNINFYLTILSLLSLLFYAFLVLWLITSWKIRQCHHVIVVKWSENRITKQGMPSWRTVNLPYSVYFSYSFWCAEASLDSTVSQLLSQGPEEFRVNKWITYFKCRLEKCLYLSLSTIN